MSGAMYEIRCWSGAGPLVGLARRCAESYVGEPTRRHTTYAYLHVCSARLQPVAIQA